jgi:hypothetical protein
MGECDIPHFCCYLLLWYHMMEIFKYYMNHFTNYDLNQYTSWEDKCL